MAGTQAFGDDLARGFRARSSPRATHAAFVEAFGGPRATRPSRAGQLAPWQLRRATEILLADIAADVPLSRPAAACGLSLSYFARAFKRSTGEPPHRWLLRRRVEHAKTLLRRPGASLAEVACVCGFSDQSHFTRVFSGLAGATPGAWRRIALG
ncbi:hypothetical protein BH10PSE4_BH10PSE4_19310 [soil metagenome]